MTEKKIPKRRNGIYYKDDVQYISITTMLNAVLAKPALRYWMGKMAAQYALEDPELNEKEVMAKVQLFTKEAADRGKYIHNLTDLMPTVTRVPEPYKGFQDALCKWWEKNSPVQLSSEQVVYNDELLIAGRYDKVYKINGLNYLVDFKTGKGIYKEVGLQLAFYKDGLHREEAVKVDKALAVCLMETGEYLEKETNDTIEDVKGVLQVYHWFKRKE